MLGLGSAAGAQLTINWNDQSSEEDGFEIERTHDGTTFSQVGTVPANVTQFVDTSIEAGTSYWYRIRAYKGAERSAYSNVCGASTSTNSGFASNGANSGRLVNLSARAIPGAGEQTLFAGFVINGAPKSILLRAIGPTLSQYMASPTLTDPSLLIRAGDSVVAENENWGGGDSLKNLFALLGAFPLGTASRDAALLKTFEPRAYTVRIDGSGSGVAMAEIYDADSAPASGGRLVNLSVRAQTGPGDGVLIVGFVIGGGAPVRVLVRAVGPALRAQGVASALADPQLDLYRGGEKWDHNDDWQGDPELEAAFAATGAFRLTNPWSGDAALVALLPPGAYTAQVTGAGGASGVALAEIYALP